MNTGESVQNNNHPMHWEELSRTAIADARIFTLYSVARKSPEGKKGDFFLLDAPDWVTVVPLVRDSSGRECFLMVEQFRHGSNSVTIEFPAGTLDEGEDPAAAAARELLEETGYRHGRLELIGAVSPNPAFMNNTMYTYAAFDLESLGKQELDEHEEIECHMVPVEEAERKMGTGSYSNGIMMIALAFYLQAHGEDRRTDIP